MLALTGMAALGLGLGPAAGVSFAAASDAYNCSNFHYQEDAQKVYDQDTSDPNGLDQGGQPGVACESLPHRAATQDVLDTGSAPDDAPPSHSAPARPDAHSSEATASPASASDAPAARDVADRDCADFASRGDAQDALDADQSDPDDLDADHDGLACERYDYGDEAGADDTPQATDVVATSTDTTAVPEYPVGGVAAGDGSAGGSSTPTDVLYYGLLSGAAVAGAVGARHLAGGRHRRS